MSIEFDGLEEIYKILEAKDLTQELGKACAIVEAAAKRKAPKDTGALKRSITSKVEDNEGVVFTPLEYAPYLEYGTGLFAENGGRQTAWSYKNAKGEWFTTNGQKPHPFMRPALLENKNKILKVIKEGILK